MIVGVRGVAVGAREGEEGLVVEEGGHAGASRLETLSQGGFNLYDSLGGLFLVLVWTKTALGVLEGRMGGWGGGENVLGGGRGEGGGGGWEWVGGCVRDA